MKNIVLKDLQVTFIAVLLAYLTQKVINSLLVSSSLMNIIEGGIVTITTFIVILRSGLNPLEREKIINIIKKRLF